MRVAVLLAVAGVATAGRSTSAYESDMQTGEDTAVSPVQKVIQMLNDMLAKGKAEKQEETVLFASYKTFCEETRAQKESAIASSGEVMQKLEADITKAQVDAEELGKQIAGHDADVAAWTDKKAKALEAREKERADFLVVQKDYASGIDSVDRALATLQSGSASLVQVRARLREVQQLELPTHARRAIMSFLQQDGHRDAALNQVSEAGGGVVEVMKGLADKFEDEKTDLEKKEMESAHATDMIVADLLDQIASAQDASTEKIKEKATREQMEADAKGDLADAKVTLQTDTEYVKDLNVECEQKSADFEKRQGLRAGEITAVSKAIEIMSGAAVSGGTAHLPSMVQQATSLLELRGGSMSPMQSRVAEFLEERAEKSHSRVLSLIAVKLQADPFKKVTKMIEDMINKLMQEAQEEAEHKGFCDTELGTNQLTRDQKTAEVNELTAESDQLTADLTKITEDIADLSADVAEIDAAVQKATSERSAEMAKNSATIADAHAAAAATEKALSVLKDFYEKAADATALNQVDNAAEEGNIKPMTWADPTAQALFKGGAARKTAMAQLAVGVPGAPETFDKPYTGQGSAGGGVVGMLEVIQSDFIRLETETKASEEEAANIFKRFTNDSSRDKKIKSVDLKHKNEMKADKESKLNDVKKDLATTQEELDAALVYFEKLKPSCVDAGVSYEDRVARRKEEIESLQEALKILSE